MAEGEQWHRFANTFIYTFASFTNCFIWLSSNVETFPKNFKITIDGKEYKVKLLNIIQNKVKDTNVEFNKKLLNDTIKDFFSDKIGGNFTNYPENFNELLFEKLSEMDNGKKIISMVNMTFLEL